MKFSTATTMSFALSLAAISGCAKTLGTQPCDVLSSIPTKPATARYLVRNDRPAAVGLAIHRKKIEKYECVK